MRTATGEQDGDPALVLVEQVAFGLSALECEVFRDPRDRWIRHTDEARDAYRAKARFVLGMAEDVDQEFLEWQRGEVRWRA